MLKIVISIQILLVFASTSEAIWVKRPLTELVRESDLIIVGTLHDIIENRNVRDKDYGRGWIDVHEVIWGSDAVGDSVLLTWENSSFLSCPRVEHGGYEGKKLIWLLTDHKNGEMRADHPSRRVPLNKRHELEHALLTSHVFLRLDGWIVPAGKPIKVIFGYRNYGNDKKQFPGISFGDGVLSVNPAVRITLYAGPNKSSLKLLKPLKGRYVIDPSLPALTANSMSDAQVEVDLKTVYGINETTGYWLSIEVDGHGAGHQQVFSLRNE